MRLSAFQKPKFDELKNKLASCVKNIRAKLETNKKYMDEEQLAKVEDALVIATLLEQRICTAVDENEVKPSISQFTKQIKAAFNSDVFPSDLRKENIDRQMSIVSTPGARTLGEGRTLETIYPDRTTDNYTKEKTASSIDPLRIAERIVVELENGRYWNAQEAYEGVTNDSPNNRFWPYASACQKVALAKILEAWGWKIEYDKWEKEANKDKKEYDKKYEDFNKNISETNKKEAQHSIKIDEVTVDGEVFYVQSIPHGTTDEADKNQAIKFLQTSGHTLKIVPHPNPSELREDEILSWGELSDYVSSLERNEGEYGFGEFRLNQADESKKSDTTTNNYCPKCKATTEHKKNESGNWVCQSCGNEGVPRKSAIRLSKFHKAQSDLTPLQQQELEESQRRMQELNIDPEKPMHRHVDPMEKLHKDVKDFQPNAPMGDSYFEYVDRIVEELYNASATGDFEKAKQLYNEFHKKKNSETEPTTNPLPEQPVEASKKEAQSNGNVDQYKAVDTGGESDQRLYMPMIQVSEMKKYSCPGCKYEQEMEKEGEYSCPKCGGMMAYGDFNKGYPDTSSMPNQPVDSAPNNMPSMPDAKYSRPAGPIMSKLKQAADKGLYLSKALVKQLNPVFAQNMEKESIKAEDFIKCFPPNE